MEKTNQELKAELEVLHPKAKTACLHYYLDECSISERKYKLKP